MTEKEAKQLTKYMAAVCQYGTAKIFANSDYKAYGKTGTADLHSSGALAPAIYAIQEYASQTADGLIELRKENE